MARNFETMAPDPLQYAIKGMMKGFEFGFQGAEAEKDRQLKRELTSKKNKESQAKSEMDNYIKMLAYQDKDAVYGKAIDGFEFDRNRVRDVLSKRKALFSQQQLRIKNIESINAGIKIKNEGRGTFDFSSATPTVGVPILQDVETTEKGEVPLFARLSNPDDAPDDWGEDGDVYVEEDGTVKVKNQKGYQAFMKYSNGVNPIDDPSNKAFVALPGQELAVDDRRYQSTGKLGSRFAQLNKDILGTMGERDIARRKESIRRGVAVDDLGAHGTNFLKDPKLFNFIQMSPETNFYGLSNNQKRGLVRMIDRNGGLQGTMQQLMQKSGPNLDLSKHIKWLTEFALYEELSDEKTFDYSNLDPKYFRDHTQSEIDLINAKTIDENYFGARAKTKKSTASKKGKARKSRKGRSDAEVEAEMQEHFRSREDEPVGLLPSKVSRETPKETVERFEAAGDINKSFSGQEEFQRWKNRGMIKDFQKQDNFLFRFGSSELKKISTKDQNQMLLGGQKLSPEGIKRLMEHIRSMKQKNQVPAMNSPR